MKCLVLVLLACAPLTSRAEYRAFELAISDPTTGAERSELSTLDPFQYVRFYPVKPSTKVIYKATWMCRGNTATKAICPNPKAK